MKPLLLGALLFASLPAADAPKEIDRVYDRWSENDRPCYLATRDQRAIQLRWVPADHVLQRIVFRFYDDSGGKLEVDPLYGQVARVESTSRVAASKIAEQTGIEVWAYRESDAIVVFTPGLSGSAGSTNAEGVIDCSMATAILSMKPASECKTGNCGRMAHLALAKWSVVAGVSEGTLSARIRARK